MRIPLAVAAGGAIGASARYLLVGGLGRVLGPGFPMGTRAANALGSFMIGVLIEVTALVWPPSPELRALLVVGVLGSFTTVSAFCAVAAFTACCSPSSITAVAADLFAVTVTFYVPAVAAVAAVAASAAMCAFAAFAAATSVPV